MTIGPGWRVGPLQYALSQLTLPGQPSLTLPTGGCPGVGMAGMTLGAGEE